MELKVGDFLIRKEGDATAIAVVKECFEKHDFYEFQSITSRGGTHAFDIEDWEVESCGWVKFDPSA
jgi:hypothetical protein